MVPGFPTFVQWPCLVTRKGGYTDSPSALFRAMMLTTPLTGFSAVRHSFARLVTIDLCFTVLTSQLRLYVCSCGDRHLECSFMLFTLIVLNSLFARLTRIFYIAHVHCGAVIYIILHDIIMIRSGNRELQYNSSCNPRGSSSGPQQLSPADQPTINIQLRCSERWSPSPRFVIVYILYAHLYVHIVIVILYCSIQVVLIYVCSYYLYLSSVYYLIYPLHHGPED